MNKFKFGYDRKVKMWVEETFIVEAETLEEAKKIVSEKYDNEDMDTSEFYVDDVKYDDTDDIVPIEEEDGFATKNLIYLGDEVECVRSNGKSIYITAN